MAATLGCGSDTHFPRGLQNGHVKNIYKFSARYWKIVCKINCLDNGRRFNILTFYLNLRTGPVGFGSWFLLMIVDLNTISSTTRRFDFTLEPEWWKADGDFDQVLGPAGPIQVSISIYRTGSKFVLNGDISGKLLARGDRCLDVFEKDFSTAFEVYLMSPVEGDVVEETELGDQDMGVDFVTGDEVNLAAIVREQIHLAMPMKVLCSENCAGICPGCGANLNKEPCRCKREKTLLGSQLETIIKK
jgi:uncharacterized protein